MSNNVVYPIAHFLEKLDEHFSQFNRTVYPEELQNELIAHRDKFIRSEKKLNSYEFSWLRELL